MTKIGLPKGSAKWWKVRKIQMFFFALHIDAINMELSICIQMGHRLKFLNYVFLFLKIVLILKNSADPDEMPLKAELHLGLQYLLKYWFIIFGYPV